MRILHLANHCHEIGNGIMNVAVDLACKEADLGHQLSFASGGGSYVRLMRRHGVEHFEIPQDWRRPAELITALARLRRLVRLIEPEIVHAHMMTGALLARALRRQAGFRLVTTIHNDWQRRSVLMGVGDRVIAVSEAVERAMRRRGIPARKLRVVRNGPLGSPRRPPLDGCVEEVSVARPAILTVAGMYRRKGIGELIDAFAEVAPRHREVQLYLVGDGPDRQAFEHHARSCRCAHRIHFIGFSPEPRHYLAQADIFVLASRDESFGLVIPEAREAGCAIVATAVGGIPEALDCGCAGILVPPRDPRRLAQAIERLLRSPHELAFWRRRATENIGWLHLDRMVAETIEIYCEALGRRQFPRPRGRTQEGLTR
jgi:glycosyltransferase involved in cell wall biosynthesis